MDKLKNILKSDTPAGDQPVSTSGKIAGQGSHFPSKEETSATGTTVTGTSPQTRGPADVSAAPASSTAAATTVGPEQGGSGHVGTTSAPATQPSTQTTEPTVVHTSATEQSSGGPNTYTISNPEVPKTETLTEGSGTAAVGETSTYSTSHLTQGNPTSSIVDPASSDPLTYKKPETGTHTTEAGVGTGAAATAAGLAFAQGEERRKSAMAGHENPYLAENLDPRVDGLSKTSAERATSHPPTTSTTTALGAGAGAGLASAGAASAFNSKPHEEVAAPSSLATTVDPANRSAEYQASTELKGLGSDKPQQEAVAPSSLTSTVDPTNRSAEYQASTDTKGLGSDKEIATETPSTTDSNRQSVVGKVLGAVGLGSVAGALGAGTVSNRDSSAVAETPEQPTTTTGLDSYTAPTQQGPPTTHHRKESIPTTAYPSGTFDSPRAINPPVGGAGSPVVHGDRESHTSRDVAASVVAGGAATGAAAVGAHEYEKSKALAENTTEPPSSGLSTVHHATTIGNDTTSSSLGTSTIATPVATTTSATAITAPTTTEPTSTNFGIAPTSATPASTNIGTTPATTATGTIGVGKAIEQPSIAAPTEKKVDDKDHSARDTAIGAGAGAAGVGAGAYGAHEYSKLEAEKADAEAAKERAAHEKELARQKAEQEKELEKQHKAEEKAAAKEEKKHEKEEKKHQKELEKEEKKHQKELDKEKEHEEEKAAIAERREKEREQARLAKEREEEEEERRNRQEKERLLGAAGVGAAAGAAGTEAAEGNEEKEKKPNIFKRIFKRRKNKDTGEDEEYESDEGHAAKETEHTPTKYEEQSGGIPKPSYNPFSKDRPEAEDFAAASSSADQSSTVAPTSATVTHGTEKEAITGLPYDPSKDPEAAQRLSEHTHGEGVGAFNKKDPAAAAAITAPAATSAVASTQGQSTAHSDLESTGTRSAQPTEAITGTTAPATSHGKDIAPSTLESTGAHTQQPASAVTGLPDPKDTAGYSGSTAPIAGDTSEHTGEFHPNTNFTLGEIQESHGSLGEKIKEALHIGSHKKEGE